MSCNDWRYVELGQIAEITKLAGFEFSKYIEYIEDGEIIAIRAMNVKDGVLDLENIKRIDKKVSDNLTRSKLFRDDIVLTYTGSKYGEVAFINEDDKYHLAPNVAKITINKDNNPYFFFCYFKSSVFRKQLKNYGGGSSQPTIPMKTIRKILVPVPTLKEQNIISNILIAIDKKIELNNEINKTLEEMAQALFKRWFVDFEFPNEEGKPYKSSGGEMVESELGMIPIDSEIKELGQLCSLSTKSVKPYENPDLLYEHFSLPACDEGKIPKMEFGNSISSNKYKIDNDCILISKLNPTTKRIWNPLCESENSICSTEFMVYVPNNKDNKDFYYEVINSKGFSEYLVSKATGSTGSRQRVKPKETLEFKVVVLNEEIVREFNRSVKAIHSKIQENIMQSEKLKELRDSLLPKLMSGEIRVEDVEANL